MCEVQNLLLDYSTSHREDRKIPSRNSSLQIKARFDHGDSHRSSSGKFRRAIHLSVANSLRALDLKLVENDPCSGYPGAEVAVSVVNKDLRWPLAKHSNPTEHHDEGHETTQTGCVVRYKIQIWLPTK